MLAATGKRTSLVHQLHDLFAGHGSVVGRIDAVGVATVSPKAHPSGDRSPGEQICQPVNEVVLALDGQPGVAVFVEVASP